MPYLRNFSPVRPNGPSIKRARSLNKCPLKGKKVFVTTCSINEAIDGEFCRLFHVELIDFKVRRVAAIKKNLVELCELELKHANVIYFPIEIVLNLKPLTSFLH